MARKMLIDATHPEETRVVVVNGNKVEEFDFDSTARGLITGNIYLAKITRVEPSLQAAFVDYGGNRHGFLAFSEIHPDYYQIPQADREALMREEIARQAAEAEAEDADLEEEIEPEQQPKPRSRSRRYSSKNRVKAESSLRDDKVQSDVLEGRDVDELNAEQPAEFIGNEAQDAEVEIAPKPRSRSRMNSSRKQPVAMLDDPRDEANLDQSSSPVIEIEEPNHDSQNTDVQSSDVQVIESLGDDEELSETRGSRQKPREPRLRPHNRYKIQEVVKVRQIMLVQVIKEERGNKGAALTTYLSLPGRYCVLMPNTARGGGISRKIANIVDRKRLKTLAKGLNVPQGAGLIIRTAGAKQDTAEIERDYAFLTRQWNKIRELTLASSAPFAVYAESGPIKRAIRDLLTNDTDEILVEGASGFAEVAEYMNILMPERIKDVKLYTDTMPLFSRYQVESYLASMFNPIVQLKSGGYLVIGVTEALIAVDVNSGRSTKEASIEDTAVKTNLEAAEEVARQLKLRDLAGLIVIDFIDMEQRRHQADVENRLKDALRKDRARIQIGRISSFGLLEMSRQRLRTGLVEAITQPCPHCSGTGILRSEDNLALSVIRAIEEEIARGRSNEINAHVPMNVANFLFNEKRDHINGFETRHGVLVKIIADPEQVAPNFKLEKSKNPDRELPKAAAPIQMQAEVEESDDEGSKNKKRRRRGGRGRSKSGNGQEGQSFEQEIASDGGTDLGETQSTPVRIEGENRPKPKSRTRTRSKPNQDQAQGDASAPLSAPEKVIETVSETAVVAQLPKKPAAKPKPTARKPVSKTADVPAEVVVEEKPTAKPAVKKAAPKPRAPKAKAADAPMVAQEAPKPVENTPAPQASQSFEPEMKADEAKPAAPKKKGWWSL